MRMHAHTRWFYYQEEGTCYYMLRPSKNAQCDRILWGFLLPQMDLPGVLQAVRGPGEAEGRADQLQSDL